MNACLLLCAGQPTEAPPTAHADEGRSDQTRVCMLQTYGSTSVSMALWKTMQQEMSSSPSCSAYSTYLGML